jgi:hypothetical protein
MMRIVDAADSDLVGAPLSGDWFSATAEAGMVNGTHLGPTKPHVGSSFGCRLLKTQIDEDTARTE